jgi:hexosaminidase
LDSTKAKFVNGAQGNVWTEYMAYPSKVEYMIFPRMSALSEVLWSPKEKKDWNDFEKRLQTQFKRYDLWKVNYSKAYFDISDEILPTNDYSGKLIWRFKSRYPGATYEVFQGLPGIAPQINRVQSEDLIWQPNEAQAILIVGNKRLSHINRYFRFNKATGKKISIAAPPNSKYSGQGGAFGLVNGVYSNKGLSYPDWLGWVGDDLEATIDLGKTTSFDSVRIHTVDQNGSWIYLPQYVEVLTSNDGNNFTSIGKSSTFVGDTLTMGWINVSTPKQSSRFIKVIAKNYGLIPDGKPGAGNKAWLFADEVQVY